METATVSPRSYSRSFLHNQRVVILGAGDVTKSLLLVSSLLTPHIKFRVIARSERSAELVRVFMNDLPKMDVTVETCERIPCLDNCLVVLTLGVRTSRFSRKSKKRDLYEGNIKIVKSIVPQLMSATVIVVTNPSTEITMFLVKCGIMAYGVGVGNDQIRFENQWCAENTDGDIPYQNHYLVGSHNFHELVVGTHQVSNLISRQFTHNAYKDILRLQDREKRLSTNNFPYSIMDYRWGQLRDVNAAFPIEFRWYAKQRIHSKYHRTTIGCVSVIMRLMACLIGIRLKSNIATKGVMTIEMPFFFPESHCHAVLGWPINIDTFEPLPLTFDGSNLERLKDIIHKYTIDDRDSMYLQIPFGKTIAITGCTRIIHDFYHRYLSPIFTIALIPTQNEPVLHVEILSNGTSIQEYFGRHSNPISIPQHRGHNIQEHSDVQICYDMDDRIIKFSDGKTFAKTQELHKMISVYSEDNENLFHELRRILRDEVCVPCAIACGARIIHAGLITYKGKHILILGPSGGGKTTAILSMICDDDTAQYGSAERVLVWKQGSQLMAMGLPESITAYPGSLKDIPEFSTLTRGIDEASLWSREHKIRLQIDQILHCSGRNPIQQPLPVDIIIETRYSSEEQDESLWLSREREYRRLLCENDLTECDDVRLPWLGWFHANSAAINAIDGISLVGTYSIHWTSMTALKKAITEIFAQHCSIS